MCLCKQILQTRKTAEQNSLRHWFFCMKIVGNKIPGKENAPCLRIERSPSDNNEKYLDVIPTSGGLSVFVWDTAQRRGCDLQVGSDVNRAEPEFVWLYRVPRNSRTPNFLSYHRWAFLCSFMQDVHKINEINQCKSQAINNNVKHPSSGHSKEPKVSRNSFLYFLFHFNLPLVFGR